MTEDELQRVAQLLHEQAGTTARAIESTISRFASDTRQHFDVTTEAIRHEVQLVAEGVLATQERLTRELTRLDDSVHHGFENTQAMIRFSHAELERRERQLEHEFSELKARVERIETAPH